MTGQIVERKPNRRGRKSIVKEGMKALVETWNTYKVKRTPKGKAKVWEAGDTIILPDAPVLTGEENNAEIHAKLTLARHHFKKYASEVGLRAGLDYTIEFDPDHVATITRLS